MHRPVKRSDLAVADGMSGLAALKSLQRAFDQNQFFDWAMRAPIVGYSLFVLIWDVRGFWQQMLAQPDAFLQPDSGVVAATLARVSQWIFIALLAILPAFRLRPIAKSDSLLPRVAALVAACVPPFFLLLKRAPPDLTCNSAAVMLSLFANVTAVVTVSFLGR